MIRPSGWRRTNDVDSDTNFERIKDMYNPLKNRRFAKVAAASTVAIGSMLAIGATGASAAQAPVSNEDWEITGDGDLIHCGYDAQGYYCAFFWAHATAVYGADGSVIIIPRT